MAWTSKFSGAPTQTTLSLGDTYNPSGGVGGRPVFTFSTNTTPRLWQNGSPTTPIAYETLASVGADISKVLRLTLDEYALGPVELFATDDLGLGCALYGPGADDASIVVQQWNPMGSTDYVAFAIENGTQSTPVSTTPGAHSDDNVRLRLYWNPTGSAFIIPDSGFGSYSLPAGTQTWWISIDGGTSWTRLGDRAIDGGVVPTLFGTLGWLGVPSSTVNEQATFDSLELMQWDEPATDVGPPFALLRRPPHGSSNVGKGSSIILDIGDMGTGINAASVIITVNGVVAWQGEAQQTGFTVTRSILAWGHQYVIDPSTDFPPNSPVGVEIYAEDLEAVPNVLNIQRTFHTGAWV